MELSDSLSLCSVVMSASMSEKDIGYCSSKGRPVPFLTREDVPSTRSLEVVVGSIENHALHVLFV